MRDACVVGITQKKPTRARVAAMAKRCFPLPYARLPVRDRSSRRVQLSEIRFQELVGLIPPLSYSLPRGVWCLFGCQADYRSSAAKNQAYRRPFAHMPGAEHTGAPNAVILRAAEYLSIPKIETIRGVYPEPARSARGVSGTNPLTAPGRYRRPTGSFPRW